LEYCNGKSIYITVNAYFDILNMVSKSHMEQTASIIYFLLIVLL